MRVYAAASASPCSEPQIWNEGRSFTDKEMHDSIIHIKIYAAS
jgi:hypothetical protein